MRTQHGGGGTSPGGDLLKAAWRPRQRLPRDAQGEGLGFLEVLEFPNGSPAVLHVSLALSASCF